MGFCPEASGLPSGKSNLLLSNVKEGLEQSGVYQGCYDKVWEPVLPMLKGFLVQSNRLTCLTSQIHVLFKV